MLYAPFDPVDVELIRQTNLQEWAEYFIDRFGGEAGFPQRLLDQLRDENSLKSEFEPILDMKGEGDSVWLGRRQWGPLLGDEGIALVREGRPIIYVVISNH